MRLIITFLLVFVCSNGFADDVFPPVPSPPRLVNDYTGTLKPDEIRKLENELETFAKESGTQIAVVLIGSLSGYQISDYAPRLAEKWGIGQKDNNNGILILIKPKTDSEDGEAFIATGYGLEGAVPDAVARRIMHNEMIPHFRNNDYYGGITSAIRILTDLTRGEYTADAYMTEQESDSPLIGEIIFSIIFLIIFILVVFIVRKANRSRRSSIGRHLPFWGAVSMLGSDARRHSGSWGDFSSDSGSDDGFGGFDGGRFGGGGAGGSW